MKINLEALLDLKKKYRICEFDGNNSREKQWFIHCAQSILIEAKEELKRKHISHLLCIALEDLLLPLKSIWDDKEIDSIYDLLHEEAKPKFDLLKLKEAVFENDFDKSKKLHAKLKAQFKDELIYQEILIDAFNFKFNEVQKKINVWKPKEHWVMKKAGLLAHFDLNEAICILEKHYKNPDEECHQENFYCLQLLSYLKRSDSFCFDRALDDKIEVYKKSKLKLIDDQFRYLINSLNPKPEKLKPYGAGRFNISKSFSFSNDTNEKQKALQFLGLLIETGFPLTIKGGYIYSSDDWYKIFIQIFEKFPYPILFFSLQYSNQDFLNRIGQDFAYSEKLKSQIDGIIEKSLSFYLNENNSLDYKANVLSFCSELFVASPSIVWTNYFIDIWNQDNFKTKVFGEWHRNEVHQSFVKKALPYLKDTKALQIILNDIVNHSSAEISNDYLYVLNRNQFLKQIKDEIQNKILEDSINNFIDAQSLNETTIFLYGNLFHILNQNQIENVIKKLEDFDFNLIETDGTWRVALYFLAEKKQILKSFKKSIINSPLLWDAGFSEDGKTISSRQVFIKISQLQKDKHNNKGLEWSMSELKKIYTKLELSFNSVEKYISKNDDIDFTSILQEMNLFLKSNEEGLKETPTFELIYKRVKGAYNKQRGYDSIDQALLSKDKNHVIWALSEVHESIIENPEPNLDIILSKVLLQSEPSIEACLNHISIWIEHPHTVLNLKKHLLTLCSILKKYYIDELIGANKPFVESKLFEIASALQKWNVKHEYVELWLLKKKNSRFNNIFN